MLDTEIDAALARWVEDVARLTKPERIVWCSGTQEEYDSLIKQMLAEGTLIELNQRDYPKCYLHRSNPNDVARTEKATFICTKNKDAIGPTNNWMDPSRAERKVWSILKRAMKGRTMYVIPYLLGPVGSAHSKVGVELTDSTYVALSMQIMTRVGAVALERLKELGQFVRGIHSAGRLDPKNKYICHFPDENLIISVNSNYGGNALLSKKCHSLRIASVIARKEGWLAEHMLVIGVEDPTGHLTYITGAFPSASGKTNMAMLRPPVDMKDWRIWAVSDDIAWMRLDDDGRFRAVNPETGFFGVAPNTNVKTNPNIMETISKNTLFTNVALTEDRTPWWEGMSEQPPAKLWDWQGRRWDPSNGPAAHPNSRFTTRINQYPFVSPLFNDTRGVPISAIIFGGRRAELMPLAYETFSWEHGVLMGAMMKVETTSAAEFEAGLLRQDPMAMIPFCGYNMGEYFRHWVEFRTKSNNLPKIFLFNAFRRGSDGKFLWPGYSQNLRVLKWIIDRCNGKAEAVETPIGYVPTPESLNLSALNIPQSTVEDMLRVDKAAWIQEVEASQKLFESFGARFPQKLWQEYSNLLDRLRAN